MKKFFLVTFMAGAMIFSIAFIFPQTVFGAGDVYIKGNVGFFMLKDSEFKFKDDQYNLDLGDLESENGFVVGAALGKSFGDFDIELEYAYRETSFDKLVANENLFGELSFDVDAPIKIKSIMANVIYNYNNSSFLTPYVGVGLGVGWLHADVEDEGYSGTELAYQFLAGVEAEASENVSILLGYRYFGMRDVSAEATILDEDGKGSFSIDSHNVEVGLKYTF